MTVRNIEVDGMTCGHCAETVTNAVKTLEGVKDVTVNLDSKQVTVDYNEQQTDEKSIAEKITGVGFEVIAS